MYSVFLSCGIQWSTVRQLKDFLPQKEQMRPHKVKKSNLSLSAYDVLLVYYHYYFNMHHAFLTWKLTQLRPLTHIEKQCSDLMSQAATQSEHDPNTNHQLTHNTLVAGVISHSLTHIAQYA